MNKEVHDMCVLKQVLLPIERPKSCVNLVQINKYIKYYQIFDPEC